MSELLKLLGDETRLRIITLLSECPCFVTDIHTILQLQQSNTSRHLQRLLASKIIEKKKCGQSICYFLNPQNNEHAQLIEMVISEYKKTDRAQKDKVEFKKYIKENQEMLKKIEQYTKFKELYNA